MLVRGDFLSFERQIKIEARNLVMLIQVQIL